MMKTKTLEALQTTARVGKTLCRIIFPLSIVGFCLCIAAIVSYATLGEHALVIGGTNIFGLVQKGSDMTVGTLYAMLAAGAIMCAGEAVLAKFTEHSLRIELEAGTPFTARFARSLLRAGILVIAIPIASDALAGLIAALLRQSYGTVELETINGGTWGFGIMMIILALVCRLGAELTEKKTGLDESETPQKI